MDKLVEAIIRECALRMGVMIGTSPLPPGLAANIELRISQWLFESLGGSHRDFIQLMDDEMSSYGRLHRESIDGVNKCRDWKPQAKS